MSRAAGFFGSSRTRRLEGRHCAERLSPEFHENAAVYQYWCEGGARVCIKIDHAALADGAEWNTPESPSPKKAQP
jgi:hypothetical protein